MNMEKIKEVFSDEAFVKGLFELDSAAEVQAALKEKGVEMCEEEIIGIRDLLIKVESSEISAEQLVQWVTQMENGEIPEEMLEQVSGGCLETVLVVLCVASFVYAGGYFLTLAIMDAVENRW